MTRSQVVLSGEPSKRSFLPVYEEGNVKFTEALNECETGETRRVLVSNNGAATIADGIRGYQVQRTGENTARVLCQSENTIGELFAFPGRIDPDAPGADERRVAHHKLGLALLTQSPIRKSEIVSAYFSNSTEEDARTGIVVVDGSSTEHETIVAVSGIARERIQAIYRVAHPLAATVATRSMELALRVEDVCLAHMYHGPKTHENMRDILTCGFNPRKGLESSGLGLGGKPFTYFEAANYEVAYSYGISLEETTRRFIIAAVIAGPGVPAHPALTDIPRDAVMAVLRGLDGRANPRTYALKGDEAGMFPMYVVDARAQQAQTPASV
jgi:hypothetical protein